MQIFNDIVGGLRGFKENFSRLWQASKSSALLLIVLEIFLGSSIVLELSLLAHLIDSTIGARSIGVWTSDMTLDLRYQVILFIIVVIALHLKEQFKGLTAKLGASIREVTFIVTVGLAAAVSSPIFLGLAIFTYPIILQLKARIWRIVFSLAVIAIGLNGITQILHLAVRQDITVGQLIWWGGALMALCGWLTLAPHFKQVN